ncbi:MAG: heavy metal-binding domain-containing protein [Alphaproteobacteria bacterium]|nr:heavy metal-binding domain-containing protein [Alphaproteobacteria bacterium]MBV9371067.1 heavy metal-binding domain-containing protein [Alphaproteobacteria bacterium]MBV9901559.1 heavy metal-binding domain-containing protein [Alphaproteobacteria bacterium]
MKLLKLASAALLVSVLSAQPATAKKPEKAYVVVNEEVGVPVFPHDITDRPYEVIGEVKAGVRKATVFSKEASQKKIYRELWERARKLGADAVINATYGDSHVSAMSWGKTNATGTAIRFKPVPAGQ